MKKYILYTVLVSCMGFAQDGSLQDIPENEITSFNQGDEALFVSAEAGYNAPAGVLLQKDESWMPDLSIDASFLYYYAQEDGLRLATSGQVVNPSGSTYLATSSVTNGSFLVQDFSYKPGFKVGINSNYAQWHFQGEYTWIRQTTTTSQAAPTPDPTLTGIGLWVINNWFEQVNAISGQTMAGSSISSKWRLAMDIADLTAGRPFYQGRQLTISPFFGLRSAWIRQKFNVNLTTVELLTGDSPIIITSNNNSNSWSIGPRAGLGASCLLGAGFRLEGDLASSMLYTEFTHVKHVENDAFAGLPDKIGIELKNYSTLRSAFEFGLGLGWGSYFNQQKQHLDFFAGYDFLTFLNQNMMRQMMDETVTGILSSPNNLYLHGLRISARFDF